MQSTTRQITKPYRVKCFTISSSLMFSGRFPTHKWRVSRTILFSNILRCYGKFLYPFWREIELWKIHFAEDFRFWQTSRSSCVLLLLCNGWWANLSVRYNTVFDWSICSRMKSRRFLTNRMRCFICRSHHFFTVSPVHSFFALFADFALLLASWNLRLQ